MKFGQKYPKISCCDLVQEDTRLHIEYVMRRLQRAATTLYGTKEYVSRRQKNALMKILCLISVQQSLAPLPCAGPDTKKIVSVCYCHSSSRSNTTFLFVM